MATLLLRLLLGYLLALPSLRAGSFGWFRMGAISSTRQLGVGWELLGLVDIDKRTLASYRQWAAKEYRLSPARS